MKSHGCSTRWRISLQVTLVILLAGAMVVAVPGCSGCKKSPATAKNKAKPKTKKQKQDEEDELEKKKKEKPKPDFEISKINTFPDDPTTEINYVKPGHWVIANLQMKANNFDFRGDLDCAAIGSDDNVMEVEKTAFQMRLSRPSTLPKGQIKNFEMLYHVPRRPFLANNLGRRQVQLRSALQAGRGGREVIIQKDGTIAMPEHCFFLTVLARDPDAYGYLKKIPSVQAPRWRPNEMAETGESSEFRLYYRVVLPKIEEFAPLPSHPLTWTSMSVVLWDELNPNQLSPDQQQAMLDWLHWGGATHHQRPGLARFVEGKFLGRLPAGRKSAVHRTAAGEFRFAESGVVGRQSADQRSARLDGAGQTADRWRSTETA